MNENELHRNHWCEWSAADLTFLEVNYRTMPLPELARILGRTPGSVRLMAHKLACQEKASPRWTAEEDDIIRQHYASGAAFIATLLKDRTSSAVFTRADTLGVTSGRYWREEERQILKEHYPAIGSGVLDLLPGRTPEAINLAADNAAFLKFVKQNGIQASMNPTRARLVIPTYSMPPLPDEIKTRLTEESLAVLSRAHEELNVGLSFSCKLNGFWLVDTQTVINIVQSNSEELTPVFYPVNDIQDKVEAHAIPINCPQVRGLNISLDDFYVDRNTLHQILSFDDKMDSGALLKVIGLMLAKLKCKSAGARQWTQELLISEMLGEEGLKAGCEFSKRYLEDVFAEANNAFKTDK